ncbi:conserved phage C-terminal domain-containing protein [Bacillus cereus]|nr:conserved phage C-terminal domain-containing protein [Bacillus cereus]MEB9179411.1 conserved phage C-terminal domain-containing protein [Bacillus cereus]
MGIFRVKKDVNYSVIHNTPLRDEKLSWRAKGLLAYMLSLPDDWTFHVTELSQHAKDGKEITTKTIQELKKAGYLKRYPVQNPKTGKISHWETAVYEVPSTESENQSVEKPVSGKTSRRESNDRETSDMENHPVEKQTLLSTDNLLSTNIPNTDKQNNTMFSSNEEDNQSSIPYQEILDYLNEKAKKNFNHKAEAHRKLIRARWNEGYTIEKFKTVIDNKVSQWLGQFDRDNEPLDRYLRPSTLFAQTHFDNYLNETVSIPQSNQQQYGNHIDIPGFKGNMPF